MVVKHLFAKKKSKKKTEKTTTKKQPPKQQPTKQQPQRKKMHPKRISLPHLLQQIKDEWKKNPPFLVVCITKKCGLKIKRFCFLELCCSNLWVASVFQKVMNNSQVLI